MDLSIATTLFVQRSIGADWLRGTAGVLARYFGQISLPPSGYLLIIDDKVAEGRTNSVVIMYRFRALQAVDTQNLAQYPRAESALLRGSHSCSARVVDVQLCVCVRVFVRA